MSLNGAKLVAEIGVEIGDFRQYRMHLYVSDAKSSGAAAKCSASSFQARSADPYHRSTCPRTRHVFDGRDDRKNDRET